MQNEYNFRRVRTQCPDCKSDHILKDDYHNEIYCHNCGLVIQDNSLYLPNSYFEEERRKELALRDLWRKKSILQYRGME